jgi:hypothetical protein
MDSYPPILSCLTWSTSVMYFINISECDYNLQSQAHRRINIYALQPNITKTLWPKTYIYTGTQAQKPYYLTNLYNICTYTHLQPRDQPVVLHSRPPYLCKNMHYCWFP